MGLGSLIRVAHGGDARQRGFKLEYHSAQQLPLQQRQEVVLGRVKDDLSKTTE
jgi:hypothetical protein